jgi:hypothetical protein
MKKASPYSFQQYTVYKYIGALQDNGKEIYKKKSLPECKENGKEVNEFSPNL